MNNHNVASQSDRELLRLHRRACTDFAARMRLPAWEHMGVRLAPPLSEYSVADLLGRAADGNLAAAASMSGQPAPEPVRLPMSTTAAGSASRLSRGRSPASLLGTSADSRAEPTQTVIESIRTVLAVAAGLDAGAGFSPAMRDLLWTRVVELTVLGYDLQQAIGAGAGLDELLVDRILIAAPAVEVWPRLEALRVELSTPPLQRLLAMAGRPAGRWVEMSDPFCSTGQC